MAPADWQIRISHHDKRYIDRREEQQTSAPVRHEQRLRREFRHDLRTGLGHHNLFDPRRAARRSVNLADLISPLMAPPRPPGCGADRYCASIPTDSA
jgi:hypothetical protein